MDYVAKYIEKDKNLDSLIDKLIKRLKDGIHIAEARNISYALTYIPFKESSFKLLIENSMFY